MRIINDLLSLEGMADKTGFGLVPSLFWTLVALLVLFFLIRNSKTKFNMYTTKMKIIQSIDPEKRVSQWKITGLTSEEVEHIRLSMLSAICEGEALLADPATINQALTEHGKEITDRFDFLDISGISFEDPELIDSYRERNEMLRPLVDQLASPVTEITGLSDKGLDAFQFSLRTGFVEASLLSSSNKEDREEVFKNQAAFFKSHNLKGMVHLPQEAPEEYWQHRKEVVEVLMKVEMFELA